MNFLLNGKTRNSKNKRNQRNRSNSRKLWFSVKRNVRFAQCYANHLGCSGSCFTSKDDFSCDEEDYQGYSYLCTGLIFIGYNAWKVSKYGVLSQIVRPSNYWVTTGCSRSVLITLPNIKDGITLWKCLMA